MTYEKTYSEKVGLKHRKKFAQFFTPTPIAELMAKWILENPTCKTILDPAFGLGIFFRTLLKNNKELEIKGFEIDSIIFEEAKSIFKDFPNVALNLKDYMFNDWSNHYDGIICNPPYFKFHDYDNKSILEEVQEKLGFKFNGFTNLYTLFLLKSIHQLSDKGRIAYIIPSEFLNSDYGKLIKQYLLKTNTLRHIFIIDFKENVFDDALTTASILLLAKDKFQDLVHFSNINSASELSKIDDYINKYPSENSDFSYNQNDLNPEIKWRKYYQTQNASKYKNLVPFSNFAKVMRGIATGANDYFVFNKEKAQKHTIPKSSLIPCISKSKNIISNFFTKEDFNNLLSVNENVYLFDGTKSEDTATKKYLDKGVKEKVNEKYLTKTRTPWYAIENRPPAPIWVSVFNRNGLKFVRNEANILNLTTFHCIYIKKDSLFFNINIDVLFAYLLTPTANEIFNDNRREYGDGLKKFEPNDLNKAKVVDFSLLSKKETSDILSLFNQFKKNEDYNFVEKLDEIFKGRFAKDKHFTIKETNLTF